MDVALYGKLQVGGCEPENSEVLLHWCSRDPLIIWIKVRDERGGVERWEVGRALFTAAGQPWALGRYLGLGDFAVCIRGDSRALLWFKPTYLPEEMWAQVNVSALEIAQLLAQIDRLTTPVEEHLAMERQIDHALQKILGAW